MTLKEVAQICTTIRKATFAWRNESDRDFMETINVWYECLKDVPFDMAMKAATEYICENNYPPTVADIYKPYKEYLENRKEKNKQLREIYYRTIAYYPCYTDTPEIQNEWMRITGNDIEVALRFERWLIDFVRQSELCGADFKPFEEFMKGVKQIE